MSLAARKIRLIMGLRRAGITDSNVLNALERIPRERSEEALDRLRSLHGEIESYLEMKTPQPEVAAVRQPEPEPEKKLLDFLTLESWYRVYNAKAGTTHWMRLLEHSAATRHVVFGGFDAEHKLAIPLDEFEAELISGRNDPLDPPPAYATALAAARKRRQRHAGKTLH